jgi:hypothetical protein
VLAPIALPLHNLPLTTGSGQHGWRRREGVMDVYTVTKVAPTIDGHGFNIIGYGRPVVHFGYEREREAVAAVEHVRQAIIKAKLIVPAGRLMP